MRSFLFGDSAGTLEDRRPRRDLCSPFVGVGDGGAGDGCASCTGTDGVVRLPLGSLAAECLSSTSIQVSVVRSQTQVVLGFAPPAYAEASPRLDLASAITSRTVIVGADSFGPGALWSMGVRLGRLAGLRHVIVCINDPLDGLAGHTVRQVAKDRCEWYARKRSVGRSP